MRQRPINNFLEFGGPSQAPKPSLWANCRKDFMNTWPLLIEDTSITMLPNLPSHQDYQGVEAFTHFLGDSSRRSLPPSWETSHRRLRCQLRQPPNVEKPGTKLGEQKRSPLSSDSLSHPPDHIMDISPDGVGSSLLSDQLSKPGCVVHSFGSLQYNVRIRIISSWWNEEKLLTLFANL